MFLFRRILTVSCYILITGVALLMILLSFFIFSNTGLKFALTSIPSLFGLSIENKTVKGTIYRGFSIENLKIENKNFIITSNEFKWIWNNGNKNDNTFNVELIDFGEITYIKKQNNDFTPPSKLPKSLKLPVTFQITKIHLAKFYLGKSDEPIFSDLVARLRYQNKTYQLDVQNFNIFSSVNKGSISLNAVAPFDLSGQIDSFSLEPGNLYYGFLKVSHNLEFPKLEVKLDNQILNISGYVWLSPYDFIATRKIISANLIGKKINPKLLISTAVDADISFKLSIFSKTTAPQDNLLYGTFEVVNSRPAYYEKEGIPIKAINLDFDITEDGTIRLSKGLLTSINNGGIDATGSIFPDGSIELMANVNLGLIDIMQTPLQNTYKGVATLTGTYLAPILKINIHSPLNQLQVDSQLKTKERILIFKKFILSKQENYFEASGKFYLQDKFDVNLDLLGKNFNPNIIHPNYPVGEINGKIHLEGNVTESLFLLIDIDKSKISGVPFFAKGFASFNSKKINEANLNVRLGDNSVKLRGRVKDQDDVMLIDVFMPNLHYFGFGISGQAYSKGYLKGSYRNLLVQLTGQFKQVKVPKLFSLGYLNYDIHISPDINAPLKVDIKGNQLNFLNVKINNINNLFTGSMAHHSGMLQFDLILSNQKVLKGHYKARGGFDKNYLWTGFVDELNLSGFLNLILQNPVNIQAGTKLLKIGKGRWTLLGGVVNLDFFEWKKGIGIKTKGQASRIELASLKSIAQLPFEHNLVLKGEWDVQYNQNASGYLKFTKESGDIIFSQRKTPLGLNKFDFKVQFFRNKIDTVLEANTRFATGLIELNVAQIFGSKLLTAPINGKIILQSDNIDKFKYMLPVGIDLKGKVDSKIKISGTVEQPRMDGYLKGTDIQYRDLSNGIFLKNGELNSRFVGEQWLIEQLSFKNQDGEIILKGNAGKMNNRYNIDLSLYLNKYLVINQPSRQFIISGQTKINLDELQGISLTGNLTLDKGKYENLSDSMPQLSDDVHVVGEETTKIKKTFPIFVDLELDLNNQLRFILSDLNFLVGGKIHLVAKKGESLKIYGKINAVEGKYRAYGQNLIVENGALFFTGAPNNATINIRARRYQSPVGAGVDVSGTFQNPRIALISDVAMSDKDKLSWLILGRESKGENDNDALALAVGVLAAEKVNKEAGSLLDNIGLSTRQKRNFKTGELNPAEQIVTFGKQLNDNLYMSYEFGIHTSSQAVRLIYAISKSLSIFGRISNQSGGGGGLKYKIRFD